MDLLFKVYALTALPSDVDNPLDPGQTGLTDIGVFFNVAFNLVAGVGFAWSFISIALGFVRIIASAGDKANYDQGMKRILYGGYGIGITMIGIVFKTIVMGLLASTPLNLPGVIISG